MAYTIGNDLYVAHERDFSSMVNPKVTGNQQQEKDVVYGQAVHRNEFGIMKGTFGVRKVLTWLSTVWTKVW